MPEGPEVKIIAEGLRKLLDNKILEEVIVNERWRHYPIPPIVVEEPLRVIDVSYRSKKIIFTLLPINGEDNFIYLVSRLGMEGKWVLKKGKHSGVELRFNDGLILYYDDTRHFGDINLARNERELKFLFRGFGPDYLIDEITEEEWLKTLGQKTVANKEVCIFLLSQKYFSGVGNYLRSEIMYDARINPRKLIGDLNDQEKLRLLHSTLEIIQLSYEFGGLTISTYWDVYGKKGGYVPMVYGRNVDDLGNEVKRFKDKDGRMVHYVPNVQE